MRLQRAAAHRLRAFVFSVPALLEFSVLKPGLSILRTLGLQACRAALHHPLLDNAKVRRKSRPSKFRPSIWADFDDKFIEIAHARQN